SSDAHDDEKAQQDSGQDPSRVVARRAGPRRRRRLGRAPTANGVEGGLAPDALGEADALEEWPGVAVPLALGRGVAGRAGAGTAVGLGVGRTVGVGRAVAGTVTVIVPPCAVVPSEPMNVTVQVPAGGTRADR